MPKKTRPKYTGVLQNSIRLPKSDEAVSPEDYAAQFEQQYIERVAALFDHYGLNPRQPGAHLALALNLAARHVPGFRATNKGPGKPRKWIGDGGRKLYLDVQALKQHGHSVTNACIQLIKSGGPYESEKNAGSLETRYYEICKTDPHVKSLEKSKKGLKRMDKLIERLQAALGTDIRSE